MKQLLALGRAAAFFAQSAVPPRSSAVVVVRAARLIDGHGGPAVSPAVVVIRDDRIESVGAGAVPAGARTIDLGSATILPGLIDLHTHLTSTGVHWEDELLKTTPGEAALHGAHNALVTLDRK